MICKGDGLSLSQQCVLLSISRASLYTKSKRSEYDNELRKHVDECFTTDPTSGARRISNTLRKKGIKCGRKKVARLMSELGIAAIYRKPNLSKPHPDHKIYPYLLRRVKVTHVNQVWSTDITYIPLRNGFVYLTAVIDWYSRAVLSWRLSTSLEASFCVEALKEALADYGVPEYFNTDQGSQFTSDDFISVLKEHETIKISMDGRGRALDNVFVERLWRTVKYEDIYLKEYECVKECRDGLAAFFERYNNDRVHQALNYRYPMEVYLEGRGYAKAA